MMVLGSRSLCGEMTETIPTGFCGCGAILGEIDGEIFGENVGEIVGEIEGRHEG